MSFSLGQIGPIKSFFGMLIGLVFVVTGIWTHHQSNALHSRGVAIAVDITSCSVSGNNSKSCYATYTYNGSHYVDVPVSGTLPSSTGIHAAKILPEHPDRPYLGNGTSLLGWVFVGVGALVTVLCAVSFIGWCVLLLGGGFAWATSSRRRKSPGVQSRAGSPGEPPEPQWGTTPGEDPRNQYPRNQ